MKAVIYEKTGKKRALVLRDIPVPTPGPGQVLVRVKAVSLNAADYRSMDLGAIPKKRIFGADVAGIVETIGPAAGACPFAMGDSVCGDLSGCGFGGLAEYVAVPWSALSPLPAPIPAIPVSGISYETAAALPMASVTALQALRNKGRIHAGHEVLIDGAGGGVGNCAVQLAKLFGARVTALCSAGNVDLVGSLGADRVLDYRKEDPLQEDHRYDLVLGVHGRRSLGDCKKLLKPAGIFVLVGGDLSRVFKAMILGPFMSFGGKKMRLLAAKPDTADLEYMLDLAAKGTLKAVIDRRYKLEQAAEAMDYLRQGHARGKVVIEVS